jgi:subtilisin family serine protease
MKRLITSLILLVLTISPSVVRAAKPPAPSDKISPEVQVALDSLQPGEMLTVIVKLKQRADLTPILGQTKSERLENVIKALQATAKASQASIISQLQLRSVQGLVSEFTPFWVFDGLSVTATKEVILELAGRSDVESITSDETNVIPSSPVSGPPEINVSLTGAPSLWSLGLYGQGIVVANMDTGVDASHPDLAGRWRGGTNSWYDPYRQHPSTPTDLDGHGTSTMGVLVGGDAGGTTIGVAPGAQWIAVKIFNDRGRATATAIHKGFQWLLDPDGNPATADAPDVVNNSWAYGGPGCNLEFQPDLQALRAAGIVPVFAAGNYGPGGSTSVSPANYPEAFAVGATDNNDLIYSGSSRGPSACGESQTIYPEVVAPGVDIRSTDLYGQYLQASGTSLSAPHVAGALALLLSAHPNLDADQQEYALLDTAVDLGNPGPDNTFGYGGLDVYAAFSCVEAGGCVPPPPPPPPLTLACASGSGQVGVGYLSALVASGGTAPYTYSIAAGSLPPGLDLSPATGAVTGTPTTAGTFGYTPTVTDSTSPTALTVTTSCSITIASPPPPPQYLHVGDLDGTSATSKSNWTGTVTIAAHDGNHNLLSGVAVSGSWSGGYSGTGSCTTGSNGLCQVKTGTVSKKNTSATFTVTGATKTSYVYQAADNHDPDGDSDGTSISVSKP